MTDKLNIQGFFNLELQLNEISTQLKVAIRIQLQ